jgi:hypothetical protein
LFILTLESHLKTGGSLMEPLFRQHAIDKESKLSTYRAALPQLSDDLFITDGGIEGTHYWRDYATG